MSENLSADRPISKSSEDRFQRYGFSRQIADTIGNRPSTECIVIGLYGAWGEGKTSVLNFIDGELAGKEHVIRVKFNPWRYQDKNILLMQFFDILAKSLKKELKTGKEKVGDLLGKYGALLNVPFLVDGSGAASAIGKLLDRTDVEVLKERINAAVVVSGKKVVIFIDDIDRLDKEEVHAIFRLVKLTADFANTTYILSFDEDMVAAAIGERFGEGGKVAGRQFLEKIVQVPLRIPPATDSALQEYTISLINVILDQYGLDIAGAEAERYIGPFQKAVLTKLDTPRLAVRYSNALSFAIPLLIGEANIVDLMLIEAVKIFYPLHYEFVKSNPEYFVGGFDEAFGETKDSAKVEKIQRNFEKLAETLDEKQSNGIKELLVGLFPRLREAFGNTSHNGRSENEWYKQQRISSEHYFNRYFSYCVIKGDLSDSAFEDLKVILPTLEEKEVMATIADLINKSTPESFMRKLRSREEEYEWPVGKALAIGIAANGDLFGYSPQQSFFYSMRPYAQSAIFISRIIELHPDRKERFELAKHLISDLATVPYCFEILEWVRAVNKEEMVVFSPKNMSELHSLVLQKALAASIGKALYDVFPEHTYKLFEFWKNIDPTAFEAYIKNLLKAKDGFIRILYALTSKIHSSSRPEPYYTNIDQKQFDWISGLIEPGQIAEKILKRYSRKNLDEKELLWDYHNGPFQTDINLSGQFMHWFDKMDVA